MIYESLSLIGLLFALVTCAVRTVADFRAKRYWWSAVAFIGGVGILTVPIQTHAVKIDLPRN